MAPQLPTGPRVNGQTRLERHLAGYESSSTMMSSELETTSFCDSEDDDTMSRWVACDQFPRQLFFSQLHSPLLSLSCLIASDCGEGGGPPTTDVGDLGQISSRSGSRSQQLSVSSFLLGMSASCQKHDSI